MRVEHIERRHVDGARFSLATLEPFDIPSKITGRLNRFQKFAARDRGSKSPGCEDFVTA
jgi:hypothetical protein